MASTEVAIRHVVTFRGASWREPRIVHPMILPLPKSSLDPRWRACADHHRACDCREAELAEEIHELRWDRDHMLRMLREELAGHATWAYSDDDERDLIAECKCTGCKIARRIYQSIGGEIVTRTSRRGDTR
ncbi:hypothetical protein [Nonomuraea sp. NPDC049784]|uniref:hypothetical protein n=1 Tax=Nonomuraea sp. NPDC049784 TaxID=3154361 RepID=UPI0033E57758